MSELSLLDEALEMAQGLFEAGVIDQKAMTWFRKYCDEGNKQSVDRLPFAEMSDEG